MVVYGGTTKWKHFSIQFQGNVFIIYFIKPKKTETMVIYWSGRVSSSSWRSGYDGRGGYNNGYNNRRRYRGYSTSRSSSSLSSSRWGTAAVNDYGYGGSASSGGSRSSGSAGSASSSSASSDTLVDVHILGYGIINTFFDGDLETQS